MKHIWMLGLIFVVACGGTSLPQPAEATLNGITKLDRDNGVAELSVSALDDAGELLEGGELDNVSAEVNEEGFSVIGGVCGTGEIESKGPLTTILTLDGSGSMDDNDPTEQRTVAAQNFVMRMSQADEAAVASFSDRIQISLHQSLTSDKSLLEAAVNNATRSFGGTNLWGAALESIEYLASEPGTNKVAIVLTDGDDTESRASPADVVSRANATNIRVFMIGLGNENTINVADMTDVASNTNGFYHNVSDDTGLDSLFNAALNASKASGCIDLTFQPVPTSGQSLTGELSFDINNKAFSSAYQVTF